MSFVGIVFYMNRTKEIEFRKSLFNRFIQYELNAELKDGKVVYNLSINPKDDVVKCSNVEVKLLFLTNIRTKKNTIVRLRNMNYNTDTIKLSNNCKYKSEFTADGIDEEITEIINASKLNIMVKEASGKITYKVK